MDDKMIGEEDLKGLEEEIDNAVDRLFVEKKRGGAESFLTESPPLEPPSKSPAREPSVTPPVREPSMPPPSLEPSMPLPPLEPSVESSLLEPSIESSLLEPPSKSSASEPSVKPSAQEPFMPSPSLEASIESLLLEPSPEPSDELERDFDLERPVSPPPAPTPFLKSIEKMEAQLLSLEWEITEEKLQKTREEVLALRELLKQKADMTFILNTMEKVLSHMIKNEEAIQPPWVKFLLDSKETIKLLMRKEADREINIYKQLAYQGIEARFSCLEGMKEPKIAQPSSYKEERIKKAEVSIPGDKKIQDMSDKMNLFMGRVEEILGTMKQQISKLEGTRIIPAPSMEPRSPLVNITIFRVDEKLFGVESEKVFKLFKVPSTFQQKYSNQQKIRLRDLEVKVVDLNKILAIQGRGPKAEIKILTVKDNGEYKGFVVDQVLKKLSTLSERGGGVGEYFSGVIHSTYQEQPVEIPILDLKKF